MFAQLNFEIWAEAAASSMTTCADYIFTTQHMITKCIKTPHGPGQDILPAGNVTYDKNKPPTFRSHPAVVFLHITVLMLDSFDQNEMTFTTGDDDLVDTADIII